MYAWKYSTFDLNPEVDESYNRRLHEVNVTVLADNEAAALDAVKALITREQYMLDEVTATSSTAWSVTTSRW